MDRLDNAISDVGYLFDCLRAYRNIVKSGNCNDCRLQKTCDNCPKPGQLVRYNCPFYEENCD